MTIQHSAAPGHASSWKRPASPRRASPPKCCWRTPSHCERALPLRALRARTARSRVDPLRPLSARADARQADAIHHRPPGILRPRVSRHAGCPDSAARNRACGGSRASVLRVQRRRRRCSMSAPAPARSPSRWRSKPARRDCATDISPAAAARRRAQRRNGSAPACSFVVCDLMSAIADPFHRPDRLQPALRPAADQRESSSAKSATRSRHVALFGGRHRLRNLRPHRADAPRVLRPGGWLIMELGFGSRAARLGAASSWHDLRIEPDLAGIPRVAVAQWQR